MDIRRIATITGWLWIVTFVTSIPARFIFYAPILEDGKEYVLGQGADAMAMIAFGALLELVLIFANIATAVVPFSIHKRVSEPGAVGYVTARVMECVFIGVGLVCMLAISTLSRTPQPGWIRLSARDSKPCTNGVSGLDRVSSSGSATA